MCKVIDELFESEKKILRAEYESELASKDEEIANYKAYIAELLSKLPPA